MKSAKTKSLRKKERTAYSSMSKVTWLLFWMSSSSIALSLLSAILFIKNADTAVGVFAEFLMLLGISAQKAIAASEYLFSTGLVLELFGIVNTVLCMIIPCMIFLKREKLRFSDCFPLKGRTVKNFFPLFCACSLFNAFCATFSQFIYDFLIPDRYGYTSQGVSGIDNITVDASFYMIAMSIIITCVLVPIAEEFMFRGVIFSALRPFGVPFAIVASATLFGVAHTTPTQSVFAFGFGVFSAFLVCVTGNIKTSILFHAINNLINVVIEYSSLYYDGAIVDLFYCLFYIFMFGFGLFGLYCIIKEGGLMDKYTEYAEKEDKGLEMRAGTAQIFCLPLIVYLVLYGALVVAEVM